MSFDHTNLFFLNMSKNLILKLLEDKMYKSFDDRQSAGSSGSGGFYSSKEKESDLSDLGFIAAGAALLYLFHAISMASASKGRKKRSDIGSGQIEAEVQEFLWTGDSGDQSKGVYGSDVQDFLWTGRKISYQLFSG